MTKLIIFQTKLEIKIKTLTNTKLSVYHLSLVIQFAREITLADNLVIVESPAKAKTIEKYLGKDIKLLLQWDTFVTYLEVKWVWTLKITMNKIYYNSR